MKNLNAFILEHLTLNKDTQLKLYNYYPKDFDELRALLRKLLEERGPDANLNDIDVSNITTFYDEKYNTGLFNDLDPHNIKIDKWNVSNITNMRDMFRGSDKFNSNLKYWDVHKVTNMQSMFDNCENFNCYLSKWKVDKVKNMGSMFYRCENFNSDLSNWNVSEVKNMSYMFDGCNSLAKIPDWYKK